MKMRVTLLLVLGLAMISLPLMADSVIYDDGKPFGFAGVPIGQGAGGVNYATSDTVQCAGNSCTPNDIEFWTITPSGFDPGGQTVLWNFASGPNGGVGYNSGSSMIPNNLACTDNGITELCDVNITLQGTLSQPAFSWLTLRGLKGDVEWAFSATGNSQAQLCITNPAGACGATLPDITPEAFNVTGVPEPGSIMLLGSGLLGVAGVLRRRMR